MLLLYSWHFSRHSMPIHWLVHGHMTSNNQTVTREMLTAVAHDGWNLSRETLRFEGNKIHCSPRDQSLSVNYYTSHSLWKIWLVESIQSIHNSLWTWHDKYNICCRYCIYHVKFNVSLVTKPLGVFCSETKWLDASLLFLRMDYVKNV